MKAGLRRRALVSMALAVGLAGASPLSRVAAQGKPRPDAEWVDILGEPNRAKGDLDTDVIAVLGRPEGAKPGESMINARAADIAAKLRCPVCQGVSIADSPAGMATKMRGQVRDLVAKGYSEDQVLTYFERSYGEFVRLEPPMRGLNWVLWMLPALVLLGGALLVFRKARQPVPVATRPEVRSAGTDADPSLAKYLERIRRDSGTSS